MTAYDLDHVVLFDTLSSDQISRLRKVLSDRVAPESVRRDAPAEGSFQSMLEAETAKLEK